MQTRLISIGYIHCDDRTCLSVCFKFIDLTYMLVYLFYDLIMASEGTIAKAAAAAIHSDVNPSMPV